MNKIRRKHLSEIQDRLSDIISDLNEIRDEEETAYENLPDSIQFSERGDAMSEAFDNIDEAISMLEDASSYIDDAMG